jgi:hypothetical protein
MIAVVSSFNTQADVFIHTKSAVISALFVWIEIKS